MPQISSATVKGYFDAGDAATTTKERGDALEDAICYVFGLVPGISVTRRNKKNVFKTQEIDVAFWNEKAPDGFPSLPDVLLVECKNWSNPVGSAEVSWFSQKVRARGLQFGVLVAAEGITGDSDDLNSAHSIIAGALREGCRLIVITRQELLSLTDTDSLLLMVKEKLCDLVVMGTIQ